MKSIAVVVLSALCITIAEASDFTVHSTFVFANTGDRTPLLDSSSSATLTTLGANQMYNLGSFFRERYLESSVTGGVNQLLGLSVNQVNNDQLFVTTMDSQYTIASTNAFMQAFYPPYTLGAADATNALAQSGFLADNNTYIPAPLDGYQYVVVDNVGQYDPYIIYLSGASNCPNFNAVAEEYYVSSIFNETQQATRRLYRRLGRAVLDDVLPREGWSFGNAYLIWDYISYQYLHNATAYDLLSSATYNDSVQQLHWLASQKQWEIYGDASLSDNGEAQSIATVGGQTLAARIAGILSNNIASSGNNAIFNFAVGEYDVMLSLLSGLSVQNINPNFKILPPYGSAIVFELFSYNNASSGYPSTSELWVRFSYVNGSLTDANDSPTIQAYPIFGNGPDQTDVRWEVFYEHMASIGLANIADWCTLCGSGAVFCPYFTDDSSSSGVSIGGASRKRSSVSPAVAGAIGALVAIAVGGIILGLAMFFLGVRFHRNHRSKKHDLGGFKGSKKLASDADLHLPKNSAPIGIVAAEVPNNHDDSKAAAAGHERVGSWEMKGHHDAGRNTYSSFGGATFVKGDEDYGGDGAKRSFESNDDINPFTTPVHARESV